MPEDRVESLQWPPREWSPSALPDSSAVWCDSHLLLPISTPSPALTTDTYAVDGDVHRSNGYEGNFGGEVDTAYLASSNYGESATESTCKDKKRKTKTTAPIVARVLHTVLDCDHDSNLVDSQSPSPSSHATSDPSGAWRCWFQCGTEYSCSSVRSIRQHFRACFALHRPDVAQLPDHLVDQVIHREQEEGRIVTGLRRWKRRRPISNTRPIRTIKVAAVAVRSETVPAHLSSSPSTVVDTYIGFSPTTKATTTISKASSNQSDIDYSLALSPTASFSPSSACTASLISPSREPSSASVVLTSRPPPSCSSQSVSQCGLLSPDVLVKGSLSSQQVVRHRRVLASFRTLKQQRRAINDQIRYLVSEVLRQDGSSHPLFLLNACCVQTCLRQDECDCDFSYEDEPKTGSERDSER